MGKRKRHSAQSPVSPGNDDHSPSVKSSSQAPVAEAPSAAAELAKAPPSSAANLSTKADSEKPAKSADAHAAARERSAGLSIQDVTGSGRGPVLRKMKPIRLSQDVLTSLAAKAVVVRVVIDDAGKVTEVTPLNQEDGAVSLPPDALATIQQWEFSRSRRKEGGEAVKYFSLKVQNPRQ